ncbi:MAG: hypothetical protein COV70_04425 [Parcubacteria group bacterium CG11_big_fil_rev_8_21_14_0_20_39_22]|nr:MAG: hypothetical protein COV70_04425 [Parcubacteria group bacterium CG11_big_fil_rev_8_21_14_0_20_39_22]
MHKINHIHITGICGVGTSALAVALKNAGYKVTGSDKGFFPPVSTMLKEAGVDFYAGWHQDRIKSPSFADSGTPFNKGGMPDLVVAGGGGTADSNPEIQFVKKEGIPLLSFAEAVGKFIVKEHSVVTAGTWGKTSSAGLLSYILEYAGFNPSYFFGGLSLSNPNGKISKTRISTEEDTDKRGWSVVEGDEYKAAIWDERPKFSFYNPTHLLLTAVSWDHADLYPTEESYFKVFEDLVKKTQMYADEHADVRGFIVACKDDSGVKKVVGDKKAIWYGKEDADYAYTGVKQTKDGLDFMINGTRIVSPMIGSFQAENITGAYAMARELGIQDKEIVEAISTFKGMKRRLEKRLEGKITIFDDIAHSADKARHTLKELRSIYPESKIIAVFEPNIGGREKGVGDGYKNAFSDADIVVIPRLSKLKAKSSQLKADLPMEGEELAETIGKTHENVRYLKNDDELVSYIKETTKKGDVVVFLGSHGFRGMIEEVVNSC